MTQDPKPCLKQALHTQAQAQNWGKINLRRLKPLSNLPFHNEQQTIISHSLKYIIRRIKVKF